MASAEKSGCSAEAVRGVVAATVILLIDRLLGLVERDVEAAELLGVKSELFVETVVVKLGRRWGIGFIGEAVLLDELLSMAVNRGEVPKSPELGSKTLSTVGSGLNSGGLAAAGPFLADSERSNIRFLELCSSNKGSSLWLSGESGSNVKSSRSTSIINK